MSRDPKKRGKPSPHFQEVSLSQAGDRTAASARPTSDDKPSPSKWNPKYWRKRVWIGISVVVVIIIVIVVAVAVTVGKRGSKYPDYSQISYRLAESYEGQGFFDKFNYFVGYDPAHGFVHYVPEPQAKELNLTFASEESAILKVDTSVGPGSVPDASTGRFSVRVESKNTYNGGLFIFDVIHTPFGCGTWPALWLTDPSNWPDHGEIDVMEATNQASDGNQMTLHTTKGCKMGGIKRKQTDRSLQDDCDSNTNNNAGCGVQGQKSTIGNDYNSAGGGVTALEWRDEGIRMWQFARDGVPPDILSQKPNPSVWGPAAADFPNTDCNIGNHFKNSSIVLNIDLCGDLVYGDWSKSSCPSNCTDLVSNHPEAFNNAYWEISAFHVYQSSKLMKKQALVD